MLPLRCGSYFGPRLECVSWSICICHPGACASWFCGGGYDALENSNRQDRPIPLGPAGGDSPPFRTRLLLSALLLQPRCHTLLFSLAPGALTFSRTAPDREIVLCYVSLSPASAGPHHCSTCCSLVPWALVRVCWAAYPQFFTPTTSATSGSPSREEQVPAPAATSNSLRSLLHPHTHLLCSAHPSTTAQPFTSAIFLPSHRFHHV
jgi:hypothetical protein